MSSQNAVHAMENGTRSLRKIGGPGRKPRACAECKKQKMKCEVPSGGHKCRNCWKRGTDCVFDRLVVPHAANNGRPHAAANPECNCGHNLTLIREDIRQIQASMDVLAGQKMLQAEPTSHHESPPNATIAAGEALSAREFNLRMAMTRENSPEANGNTEHNGNSVTVEEPMGSLFHTSLNHYLWVGLEQTHPDFKSVRESSELLTATILTVTALHIPTSAETFDKCYKEFLLLISSSMFSRYHSVDDVRALCIAAFWLSEAYGRPPMIAESLQIRDHELFLQSPFADALDRRILSQVSLMQILTRIYDRFIEGSKGLTQENTTSAMLADEEGDFDDLRAFNGEIDRWRLLWHARQEHNPFIGSFPPKGIILYCYFAKLQLNSLAIRGVSLSSGQLSTQRKEYVNLAISAAASILTFVLEEEDMRRALVGTPLYVHTMITFASAFLMKCATMWSRVMGLYIEAGYITSLLERVVSLLKTSVTSDRHVLYHIAFGLEKMLAKFSTNSGVTIAQGSRQAALRTGISGSDNGQFAQRFPTDGNHVAFSNAEWGAYTGPVNAGAPSFSDEFSGNLLFEAFGSGSANDVYDLLTSQLSY
ncbi:c6 transcription [Diaporthe amygdali]|uniref:c6 transcription n=1 Tax=Phomopsis amygdali TaxID=1214568 RepID=UPI0022FE5ABC|nr:c6 transcription [Diaporthe amygdali]KAJ0124476.1 c6 transcription [Diaporthe amygdali]